MKYDPNMRLDILIKKEQDYYIAHCLQFDLVATDEIKEGVSEAIVELCKAHIDFSLKNDNMEYLFSPAPKEVWAEYYLAVKQSSCPSDAKGVRSTLCVPSLQERQEDLPAQFVVMGREIP